MYKPGEEWAAILLGKCTVYTNVIIWCIFLYDCTRQSSRYLQWMMLSAIKIQVYSIFKNVIKM